ncbi:MAG: hypothetical protein GXP62_18515, partial [Oligoflexia bacterium]|nr:hypothetical protein [Oligoflexia bacterium]
ARITGTVTTDSHRLSFHEEGGADISFTGVVRGTGMMGTYGRSGQSASLSWSARRQ